MSFLGGLGGAFAGAMQPGQGGGCAPQQPGFSPPPPQGGMGTLQKAAGQAGSPGGANIEHGIFGALQGAGAPQPFGGGLGGYFGKLMGGAPSGSPSGPLPSPGNITQAPQGNPFSSIMGALGTGGGRPMTPQTPMPSPMQPIHMGSMGAPQTMQQGQPSTLPPAFQDYFRRFQRDG